MVMSVAVALLQVGNDPIAVTAVTPPINQTCLGVSLCVCVCVCLSVRWLVDSINSYEIRVPGRCAPGEALMERQVAVWVIGLPVPEGDSRGENRIFKPHSQQANTQSEQCALGMIKANGFSSTQICCWTSKVCVFRIYKCVVWRGCLRESTGGFSSRVRTQWHKREAERKLPSSAFQHFSITFSLHNCNTLNHIVACKMQLVVFPSTLSHCAYLAGWGFGWLQHLSWER